MAKKSNKKKNNYNFVPQPKKSERLAQAQAEETKVATNEDPNAVTQTQDTNVKAEKVDKNSKNAKKAKVKKEKKPNRLVKGTKEIGSELKKVSWPSFKKVVKQTGIVIAVVLFFAIILFGIEMLCSELYRLLANAIG